MTIHLETQSDLEEAVEMLVKRDPRLKPVLEVAGMTLMRMQAAYELAIARAHEDAIEVEAVAA